MKRRFTILTAALALLAILAIPMGMKGQTAHTIGWGTASGDAGTYTNFTATSGQIANVLSFSSEKNSSSSNPAYNANASELRLYYASSGDGGSITITPVAGVTITDAVMTTSTTPSVKYYVDGGTGISVTASNNTYTISDISATTSLKIQNVNTSNTQLRIKTIELTYTTSGSVPTTYTVTYHANVTGIDDITETYTEGEDVPVADNSFSNPGYAFTEWNTEADGTGDSYSPEDVIEDINDDLDLYAQWEESDENTATLTATNLELTGLYTSNTEKTIDDITYVFTDLMLNTNRIQAKATTGTIKNTTAYPGDIVSVTITHDGTARATTINGSADGTNWTQVATGSGSITADFSGRGYKYFQITRGSNAAYWTKIEITYSTSSSSQSQSDLAITNASTDLTFDLYNNTTAQVISYTTSSTGAITITPAESIYFSYVHDATAKTITVTPLAVTPSAQTVTIDQEADDNYYGGSASFTVSVVNSDPNAPGTENNPYTVAQARAAIDAGIGTQGVYATGIVSAIPTAWSNDYHNITFNFVDNEGDNDFLQAYRCVSTDNVDASTVAVGDVVVVYGNLTYYASSQTYEFASGCQLVSLTHPVVTTPTVTVTPNTINVPFAGAEGILTITYENIPELISFDYYFCDPNGGELEDTDPYYPDWIDAEINEENGAYVLSYSIDANQGEARSAYFKVYTTIGDEFNPEEVYAIVTVNQDEYVAPTYAELPFEFNSGKDDIEDTDGLYQNELGADYSANTNPYTRLKFDSTGDWLLLQFDERPGKLTFNIKGNSFSGGTFTVQTSEDGTTYTNLDTYTSFGSDVESKEYDNLGENVRYIKWIYTTKASGNVGLGNIKLAAYEAPALASITITPDNFELDANAHMAEVLTRIAYQNIAIVPGSGNGSFSVQYYDADGQELQQTWCVVGATPVNGSDDEFDLGIVAFVNDGTEARTAYFKLYGHDAEDNVVYSNLVTITQAAPVVDYAVLPFVWQGGASADFLALNGVTAHNLGSDYAAGNAPYLIKFDNTGDYIQVKTDNQPGKVTIGVKMIGGANTSTITIQGSADGETFTDIEELTISGEQNNVLTLETTNVFGENDRYVRMLFTKGSNVGVGPITIEKGNAPSITVTPATIDLAAAGQGTPYQMTQMNVTYSNLEIEDHDDFAVQFYDAEGQEQTQPDWIIMTDGVIGSNEAGYLIAPIIAANQGPARSAYFKVYALGEEDNVYSNLVTINQAGAAVQQYTLTVEPFDNLEIFTFIDDELTEPMEGAGSIQVTEGTSVMLSVSAVDGFVMETLMVNGVNHVNDIAEDLTYTFEMPAEDVTIIATAVENVPSYTLTIDGYQDDNNEGGYYLIASPVTVDLSNHEMTTGDFDLYYFDQAQDDEWRNYEANAFSLEPGKGYLYAHKTGGEFTLTGTPYNGNGVIELDYDSNATDFQGWNLVGNPWGVKAYPNHDFYTMNSDGSGIDVTVYPANTEVAPMTGIFVVAEGEGETVTFAMENSGNKNANLALNLTNNNKLIDRAIVRFGEGRQLPKFQLNPNHTKVYFTMDNKDFALVRSEAQGEMPVSFKAENNGTYTFSVNAEEVNFSYLHLIDNMTGNDIDLLSTPSYSFEATTSDYANRFRLVFSANDTNSENFAFVNNGEIIVTGQGTVQVYDVTGRMISTHNNVNRIATEGMSAGVYMLHLINGSNVKTQKIVVK